MKPENTTDRMVEEPTNTMVVELTRILPVYPTPDNLVVARSGGRHIQGDV